MMEIYQLNDNKTTERPEIGWKALNYYVGLLTKTFTIAILTVIVIGIVIVIVIVIVPFVF